MPPSFAQFRQTRHSDIQQMSWVNFLSCSYPSPENRKCDQRLHKDIFLAEVGKVFEIEYNGSALFVQVHSVIAGCYHFIDAFKRDPQKYARAYGSLISPFFSTERERWLEGEDGAMYGHRGNIRGNICLEFNASRNVWDFAYHWQGRGFVRWLEKDEHRDFDFKRAAEHPIFEVSALTTIMRSYRTLFLPCNGPALIYTNGRHTWD